MTSILGISAFYHDSSACLIKDSEILTLKYGVRGRRTERKNLLGDLYFSNTGMRMYRFPKTSMLVSLCVHGYLLYMADADMIACNPLRLHVTISHVHK